jgi:hypothetical protein
MICSIIILIILMQFSRQIMVNIATTSKDKVCEESVRMNQLRLRLPNDPEYLPYRLVDSFGNPVDITCSTHYIDVKTKEPEEIKKLIADEMYSCWKKYGRGEIELFDTEDNNYCAVCSRLSFEEEVEVRNLLAYLKHNDRPGKEETYWDYLMGVRMDNFITEYYNNKDLQKYDNFRTEFPMAVMFVMQKDAYPGTFVEGDKITESAKLGGAGAIGGAFAGTAAVLITCAAATGGACAAIGVVAAIVGTGGAITGGTMGGAIGYIIGSDSRANWDANILLWDYDHLNELNCNFLESKSTPLTARSYPEEEPE